MTLFRRCAQEHEGRGNAAPTGTPGSGRTLQLVVRQVLRRGPQASAQSLCPRVRRVERTTCRRSSGTHRVVNSLLY